MKQIGNYLVYWLLLAVSYLPYWLLYLFANFLAFFFRKIIKYRKAVVYGNLRKVFPDKPDAEIETIAKKFYTNFADIFVEGIKGFSISDKTIMERFSVRNPEILYPYMLAGKTVLTLPAHYGNWEGYTLSPPLIVAPHPVFILYKQLANSFMEKRMIANRSRTGSTLVPLQNTFNFFEENKKLPKLMVMVSDQSPSRHHKAIWVNFLGIETACLHGAEKYAKLHDCPVFYLNIQRVKRGYYEIEVSLITDEPTILKEGEITQGYFNKLEAEIIKEPANWLWSHRRWKEERKTVS